jgi:hypothetical protein
MYPSDYEVDYEVDIRIFEHNEWKLLRGYVIQGHILKAGDRVFDADTKKWYPITITRKDPGGGGGEGEGGNTPSDVTIVRVYPMLEIFDSTIAEHEFTVAKQPANAPDLVEIEWLIDGEIHSFESEIFSIKITLHGNPATHNITALPIINGVKTPEKAINWTVVLYSTCIWCGHRAMSDAGWPQCPSCGKLQ